MSTPEYNECFDILANRVGINPDFNIPSFAEEQKEYFHKIYTSYREKTKQEFISWLNKQQDVYNLTFKDWYNDSKVQKDLKNISGGKFYQETTDTANISEIRSDRKIYSPKLKFILEHMTQGMNTEGIHISKELLDILKKQFPEYSTPFKYNILCYLASDAKCPLVLASYNKHVKLWGMLLEMSVKLRGLTHKLVVSPAFYDYELAPHGVWEPFSDNIGPDKKTLIDLELAPREDKVGFFSINLGDEKFTDRVFLRLFRYFSKSYKSVVLVDSSIAVPSNHWLVRELEGALIMEYEDE